MDTKKIMDWIIWGDRTNNPTNNKSAKKETNKKEESIEDYMDRCEEQARRWGEKLSQEEIHGL
jgi:hypothetical protein